MCCHILRRFLFEENPSDTFQLRSLKNFISVAFCVNIALIAYILTSTVGFYHGEVTVLQYLFGISSPLIYVVCTITLFVKLKVTKTLSYRDGNVFIVSCLVCNVISAFSRNEVYYPLVVGVMGAAVGLQFPYLRVLFTIEIMNLAVMVYNKTYGMSMNQSIIVFHNVQPPFDQLMLHVLFIIVILVVFYGTYLRTEAFDALLRRSVCATELSKEMAMYLSKYDTKRAQKLLLEYSHNADCVEDLHTSFFKIVENMEVYRSFLPNYLSHVEDGAAGENILCHVATNSCHVATNSDDVTSSSSTSGVVTSLNGMFPCPTHVSKSSTMDVEDFEIAEQQSSMVQNMLVSELACFPCSSSFKRLVTVAQLNYHVEMQTTDADVDRLVDCISEKADAYHGTVHSFLGDIVTISWNSIRRTAQAEVKALKCTSHWRHFGPVSIVTEMARCQLAGGSAKHPTIHSPELWGVLAQISTLAKCYQTCCVSERTAREGAYCFEYMCIDAVQSGVGVLEGANDAFVMVCEILGAEHHQHQQQQQQQQPSIKSATNSEDVCEDEWMYRLSTANESPDH
eukprot:PhF_6_TR13239/c0_g1_i1/m.20972